jgi:hypothetical protein
MYIIPALGCLLTLVLFAGSRTVTKDMERLRSWMSQSAAESNKTDEVLIPGAADAPVRNV